MYNKQSGSSFYRELLFMTGIPDKSLLAGHQALILVWYNLIKNIILGKYTLFSLNNRIRNT